MSIYRGLNHGTELKTAYHNSDSLSPLWRGFVPSIRGFGPELAWFVSGLCVVWQQPDDLDAMACVLQSLFVQRSIELTLFFFQRC